MAVILTPIVLMVVGIPGILLLRSLGGHNHDLSRFKAGALSTE